MEIKKEKKKHKNLFQKTKMDCIEVNIDQYNIFINYRV